MKRNNLSFRRATHVAQQRQEVFDEKMQSFLKYIIRLRRLREYELPMIGNMDETPIWVDMPGNYTVEGVGSKTISMGSTGHEKSRITVMLSAMADGTKLPPMVLLKGVRPVSDVPAGIIVKMTPKAWADEGVTLAWLNLVWRRNVNKRLLVWDSFRGHLTPKVKEAVRGTYNIDMAVIPGGTTSKLQPCDVSWNRPFKDKFRDLYDEWLVDGPKVLTKGGNRKSPDKPTLLKWIKEAWFSVTADVIRKSFRVTGISLPLDGSEDNQLFNTDSDDEDPFEGFISTDVDTAKQFQENVELDGDEYSNNEPESDEFEDEEDDPGSPGH